MDLDGLSFGEVDAACYEYHASDEKDYWEEQELLAESLSVQPVTFEHDVVALNCIWSFCLQALEVAIVEDYKQYGDASR